MPAVVTKIANWHRSTYPSAFSTNLRPRKPVCERVYATIAVNIFANHLDAAPRRPKAPEYPKTVC
jgi:hypothetical protein